MSIATGLVTGALGRSSRVRTRVGPLFGSVLVSVLTLASHRTAAASWPDLPPIIVHECIDAASLQARVRVLLGGESLTWPASLAYAIERTPDERGFVLVVYSASTPDVRIGPFFGDCAASEAALASTIASELRSQASAVEPDPPAGATNAELTADAETVDNPPPKAPEPPENQAPDDPTRNEAKQVAKSAAPRQRDEPLVVHPALSAWTGYGAVPSHAGRADGHAGELQARLELMRPGGFSVGLGLRNLVSLNYGNAATVLFGELSVCRVGGRKRVDGGICGSGAYGWVDMPGYRQKSWLLGLSGRLDVWLGPSTAVQMLAGITGSDATRLQNASNVYPHVTIGTRFTFGCRERGVGCRD